MSEPGVPVEVPANVMIIAEAGVNHNGSPVLAHRLIDVAADAGADAVKFQTFLPELLVSAHAVTAGYQAARTGMSSQREMIESLALPIEAWRELADHTRDRKLTFLSTAFDLPSLDLLEELGVPLFKVPSGEITNLPFIRLIAARNRPLVISTGTANLAEVGAAVDAAASAPAITLLHCVSSYPAPVESANLRAITTLRATFALPVGWSDHTRGSLTAVLSVALEASIIEKHFTLDRNMVGPDHAASADPAEFSGYVNAIREAEVALGAGLKEPHAVENDVKQVARRSWHAARVLGAGTTIGESDFVALRPGVGVSPVVDVVGRTLMVDLVAGEPLMPAHIGLVN